MKVYCRKSCGGSLVGVCANIVAGLQKKPQIPQHLQRCGIMLQAKDIIYLKFDENLVQRNRLEFALQNHVC